MPSIRAIGLALAVATCMVAVAEVVNATAVQNLPVPSKFPARLPRTLTTVQDADKKGYRVGAVNVVSKGVGSLLTFWATTTGFPRLRTNYFTRDGDAATALSYRTALFAVVEYVDNTNHDFRLSRKVQGLSLINLSGWSDMTVVQETVNSATVYTFSSSVTAPCTWPAGACAGSITVTYTARISSQVVQYNLNTTLSPNVMKFDVAIQWPFARNDTKVGILVGVMSAEAFADTTNPTPLTNAPSEGAIQVGSNSEGMFSWATQVAANFPSGVTANEGLLESPVWSDTDFANYTSVDDTDYNAAEEHHGFFFTFNTNGVAGQSTTFTWDPANSLPDGSSAAGLLANPLVTLAAVAAAVLLSRRV